MRVNRKSIIAWLGRIASGCRALCKAGRPAEALADAGLTEVAKAAEKWQEAEVRADEFRADRERARLKASERRPRRDGKK